MRLRSPYCLLLAALSVGCGRSLAGAACPCVEGYECCANSRTCEPRGGCGDSDSSEGGRPGAASSSPPDTISLPEYCSSDGWCGANVNYSAVFGTSPSDIWVAAHDLGDRAGTSTLLHFDGARWSMASVCAPGLEADDIGAVWAASVNDVWVGDSAGWNHWDGATWTHSLPNYPQILQNNVDYDLTSAPVHALFGFAPNDVWSAGPSSSASHWDGSAWTTTPTTDDLAAGLTRSLWGVWGSRSDDVWFVGDAGTLVRWDGQHFSRYGDDFGAGATTANLRAVCGTSSDDAWAVGEGTTVLRWDGKHWQNVGFSVPLSANLDAVWCDPSGDVWIAGDDGSLARWDGGGWYELPLTTKKGLRGLWGMAGAGVWSVGDGGQVEHWNGAAWSSAPSPPSTADWLAVWSSSADDVWAFASDDSVHHFDGQRWSDSFFVAANQPMAAELTGSAPSDVWAVAGGGIFHSAGSDWSNSPGIAGYFNAGWARAADDVWAVGKAVDTGDPATSRNGAVAHWDGAAWVLRDSGVLRDLTSVWGFAANDFWITTSGSEVLHSDGAAFTSYDLSGGAPNGTVWDRISGTASNDVWFFGRYTWTNAHTGGLGGVARRWNGTSFDAAVDLAVVLVNSVWFAAPNDAYVLRDGVHVTHLEGTSWTDESTSVTGTLLGLWGNDADLWAVGTAGTIVRKHRSFAP